ncbi:MULTISPECIES: ATP-binding protein [Chromobacterium]|uniref:AAA family ATPase n=1 Tax=Chromobacterium TaxID=535 RepID=UPI000D3239B5|nr:MULTISPECIES: ATP-binding protein [Chromobacterium]MCP1291050.1 ATP-binding protein [Chromobacterium sp. S0633]PTU65187.1 cell division protein ZipA [Chromobacterium sp. Panama]UJB30946.1 ATP-binding protein [Chromobacterium sp. Beijing]
MPSNEQFKDTATEATLHLVCGKIAAGKSTLTRRLSDQPRTVLISEDDWLAKLYPGEIRTLTDYVRRSQSLKDALAPHVSALLRQGLSVVLDMPANTLDSRRWMRELIESSGAAHQLHHLDVSDEACKARLRQRNAKGSHPFSVSEAEFDHITRYFVPPSPQEGFNVVAHLSAEA